MSKDRSPTPPTSGNGSTPAGNTTTGCPCQTDFQLTTPCRIVKVNGGRVQLTAANLPGVSGGTYAWTTTSAKIRLHNANSATVTVEGLANVSSARDAETITVTRSQPGCSPVRKTVNVTVAKVTFSKSNNQLYGYDNYDTPANQLDDHLSVKKSRHTFLRVVIEGGATSSDFEFVPDSTRTCRTVEPAAGQTDFHLRINGRARNKEATWLRAKLRDCPGASSFAWIRVHVYKEKYVEVVVAKIYDSTVAGTNLRFPNENYANQTNTVNAKLKEAVVKYNITNFDSGGGRTNVRYDLDNNGALSYDIKNGGGRELNAIKSAFTGTGTKTRVIIVRQMKSYYYLSAAAAANATTITLTASNAQIFYRAGDTFPLGTGATRENVTVASIAGSTITLTGRLRNAHAVGESMEFPAAGWSSDPILVVEGNTNMDTIMWTIVHEVGHRNLNLRDVIDTTSVMHFSQGATDNRLRYCPRTRKYDAGTENQWETVPR